MEVLLIQDFPQLGFVGEQMNVKNGYARNYLIPRGIAIEASSCNAKEMQHRLAMVNARRAKKKAEATELLGKLQQVSLEFKLKFAEEGKSFGSVSVKDIYNALIEKGFEVDRKQLVLSEPIKSVGDYEVAIKLHSEVTAKVPVKVIAEKVAEPKANKQQTRKPRHSKAKENIAENSEEVADASSNNEAVDKE